MFEVCGDRAELSLFADDIAVVPAKTGEEGDGKLFKSLVMFHDWSKMWRLDFNAKKSKVLRFSVKRKTKSRVVRKPPFIQQFFLGAEIIERVTQFDYLGLRWQEDGQWHLHTAKVCTAAKRVSSSRQRPWRVAMARSCLDSAARSCAGADSAVELRNACLESDH